MKLARRQLTAAVFLPAVLSVSLLTTAAKTVIAQVRTNSNQSILLPSEALLQDVRLRRRVTVESSIIGTGPLFARLYRATRVRLYTNDLELKNSLYSLHCRDLTLAGVMDGIAAKNLLRWKKDVNSDYELVSNVSQWEIYLPKGPYREDAFKTGLQFAADFKKLPPNLQADLLSANPVSVSRLPESARASLGAAFRSQGRERQSHDSDFVPPDDISQATVRLEIDPQQTGAFAFTSYFLTLHYPGHGMGWEFNDYPERKAEEARSVGLGKSATVYAMKAFELTQEEAKKLPILKQMVYLKASKITLPEALQSLCVSCGVPYTVGTGQKARLPAADINLPPMPLGDALDRLTEIYEDNEWEYRKLGVVVMRRAKKPYRENAAEKTGSVVLPNSPKP